MSALAYLSSALLWMQLSSPILVDQVPRSQPNRPSASVARALADDSSSGSAEQTKAQQALRHLVEECREAELQGVAWKPECDSAMRNLNAQPVRNAESNLLDVFGFKRTESSLVPQSNGSRSADALAADAGAAQGIRTNDAAAIVVSQRAAAPPGGR